MPRIPAVAVSNSRADRAGRRFREIMAAPGPEPVGRAEARAIYDELAACIDLIETYRRMHEYPLRKVTMGVRVMIENELKEPAPPRPAQRFKRMPRIIQKLMRFPHMRLSQMEDIGGCRAVLATLEDVRRVERRLHRR